MDAAESAVGHYCYDIAFFEFGPETLDDGVGVGERFCGLTGRADVGDEALDVHHVAVGLRIFKIKNAGDDDLVGVDERVLVSILEDRQSR